MLNIIISYIIYELMIYNLDFMINYIITFIRKDLHNLLHFLRFYNVLRVVCLVNNTYIYIKCISKLSYVK